MDRTSREIERRRRLLEHARVSGNVAKSCRYFGVGRASFYRWRERLLKDGDDGLVPRKPGPTAFPTQTPTPVVEAVLHLRKTYHLGPMRIVWYLDRYHGIKISDATVYRILRRNGVNRLPGNR